jgi:hypothetical protein
MNKIYQLLVVFVCIANTAFTQTKQFATKQEAETFIVETIKKLTPAPFTFSEYKNGALLFKNPKTEKIDKIFDEGSPSEYSIAGETIKCNAYSVIYLNKIKDIKIDTLLYPNEEKRCRYAFVGDKIGEIGYMPLKSTVGSDKRYRNIIVFLDRTTKNGEDKQGLFLKNDVALENDFLEAVRVYWE